MLVTQSCPTLCDPMDCSLPGSSVHGIRQARILEWVAIPFSRDLPDPGIETPSLALQLDSLPSKPPVKLVICYHFLKEKFSWYTLLKYLTYESNVIKRMI